MPKWIDCYWQLRRAIVTSGIFPRKRAIQPLSRLLSNRQGCTPKQTQSNTNFNPFLFDVSRYFKASIRNKMNEQDFISHLLHFVV